MMIVQMDKMSALTSRERACHLYDKNIKLENKRRESAQARVPSDPNAWQLMRENYEAIILEDHVFSEQHNIEYALWHLHYKRIEELRAHYSAASQGSNTSKGLNGTNRPRRLTRIRTQLKTFLSEATGFYHDLILKIRARYGFPLGYSSVDYEKHIVTEKNAKRSADMKKGLISCHRCLIYLGDLARYKGLYGDGDSKTREHAAASSYYLLALSRWPSSGNPHHQLAILASYKGDDLVVVYRYFRSLAVNSPISTARDNLIVAFEKNRQCYSQLLEVVKASVVKEPFRITSNRKGKGDIKHSSEDTDTEVSLVKEQATIIDDVYKAFCIRFVRLNGILFTRTSLETLPEVLSSVSEGLCELLSSGPEEELNFGADAVENGDYIVKLVAILIFTVCNVNKETEDQTYAEILQRAVLVQNALAAVFEILGHILERCTQLPDPSSSFLLPGILVFVEWLACCPDVAAGSVGEVKQVTSRFKFWNLWVSFFNKLLSIGIIPTDDDGKDTCFYHMNRYEDGETENRLALWEDFELRGFLPLLPAQSVLDFSENCSFRNDSFKERKDRVKRILAAGKALVNVIKLDEKIVYFDLKEKKFILGVEPPMLDDFILTSRSSRPKKNEVILENEADKTMDSGAANQTIPLHKEGEDDDEEIVFKPVLIEKLADQNGLQQAPYDRLGFNHTNNDDLPYVSSVSAPPASLHHWDTFVGNSGTPLSVGSIEPQIHPRVSNQPAEESFVSSSLKSMGILENGQVMKLQGDMGISHKASFSVPISQSVNGHAIEPKRRGDMGIFHNSSFSVPMDQYVMFNTGGLCPTPTKALTAGVSTTNSVVASSGLDSLAAKTSSALPAGVRKNPVSRPVRHVGPPPGFSPVPPKQVNESISSLDLRSERLMDDHGWLNGYQLPTSVKDNTSISNQPYPNPQYISNNNGLTTTASFPFPGKQGKVVQFQDKQISWEDYQHSEHFKSHQQPHLQQKYMNGNQPGIPLPEQYQGQSVWAGRYIV